MSDRPDDTDQASPACWMHEADPAYMGFAGREEIVLLLNRLRAVLPAQHAMLDPHILALGGVPADIAGTLVEALALLRSMLARIRDDGLHADLKALLKTAGDISQ